MKKKIVIVLFIAVCLVMGGALSSQKADAEEHMCWVPYCIKTGNWYTGVHFRTETFVETLTIRFWQGSTLYETVTLNLTDGTWTGAVESLLANPANFQSPSLLYVISTNDHFTATQFITNTGSATGGFGFQTFQSWPFVSPFWPNGSPLSEPQDAQEGLTITPPAK